MTDEQIIYLIKHNMPCSPSLFKYTKQNFNKYCAILQLAAYRNLTIQDSNNIEEVYCRFFKENSND